MSDRDPFFAEPEAQDASREKAVLCVATVVLRVAIGWAARGRTEQNRLVRLKACELALLPPGKRHVTLEAQKLGCTREHLHREISSFLACAPFLGRRNITAEERVK